MKQILNKCKPIQGTDGYFISPEGKVYKLQEIQTYNNHQVIAPLNSTGVDKFTMSIGWWLKLL